MNETNKLPQPDGTEPEILVNSHDGAVAVDEKDRTVLLTKDETIIVEKEPVYDIAPANRPRKVYGGMWGPTEIGVVGAASLAVVAALATFFFFTLPAKRELERNRATDERLKAELASAQTKYGDITSTETQVSKLVSSATDFESIHLPVASNGRTALYQKLNGLIAGHGLVNTSGPDYAPLDIAEAGDSESAEERGRSRFRSLFPGAYVTMTLEGPYANLRRFVSDVETGNDFVIISSVELEPSDNQPESRSAEPAAAQDSGVDIGTGFPGQARPPFQNQNQIRRPSGRTLGQVVSLRLEMAAYFRRTVMEVPTEVQGN